jgi:predicted transcriptional regulator
LKNPIPANDSLEVSGLKSEERVALQKKLDELKADIEKFKEESTAIENFCNELIKKLSEDEGGGDEDDNESLGLPMNSDG